MPSVEPQGDPDIIEWGGVSFRLQPGAGVTTGIIVESAYNEVDKRRGPLPALLAHRPQMSRFLRCSRIVGAARAIALTELGPEGLHAFGAAMVSIEDCKGDFTVVWHKSDHRAEFESIVARALAMEGENPNDQLMHRLMDDAKQ